MAKGDNPKQDHPVESPSSLSERREQGKQLRDVVRRNDHGAWYETSARDPIEVLDQSNVGRIAELIPIRYGRMLASPFAFFRGAASLMAADLSSTPDTGLRAQICGDCHCLNFGAYASPERNLVIDLNDFDETSPGPWEWDVKRLATSMILACRANSFKPSVARDAAESVARSYREAMQEFSEMKVLDVWYSKLSVDTHVAAIKDKQGRQHVNSAAKKALESTASVAPKLTTEKDGRLVFKDSPPLLYHSSEPRDTEFLNMVQEALRNYRATLSEERQVLVDRFEVADIAMKIVGVGSVGTYCAVMLLRASEGDHLILQIKEARQSVLEPYTGKSLYKNHGQRVVVGQRLMQASSDIFLGWTQGPRGRQFYVRQLKDMKVSPSPELWTPSRAVEVGQALGWVLARAHARSGDSVMISGYMGSNDIFDKAIAQFAVAYADQTERYHKELVNAVKRGRVKADTPR
jgi:uncharacterized protein (DUF2252 family)